MENFAFIGERDEKANVGIISITQSVIIKGSLTERLIKNTNIASISDSDKILSQFAGTIRDDLFNYLNKKNKSIEFPLLSNIFCYAFAKGVEFAYLWSSNNNLSFKFECCIDDAINNNARAFVVSKYTRDIVIGMEKAHNVFCDLQDVIVDRRYPFYQGGRLLADLLASSFYWATQIGIDFGMNLIKNK
jgi:hypothetical protein